MKEFVWIIRKKIINLAVGQVDEKNKEKDWTPPSYIHVDDTKKCIDNKNLKTWKGSKYNKYKTLFFLWWWWPRTMFTEY